MKFFRTVDRLFSNLAKAYPHQPGRLNSAKFDQNDLRELFRIQEWIILQDFLLLCVSKLLQTKDESFKSSLDDRKTSYKKILRLVGDRVCLKRMFTCIYLVNVLSALRSCFRRESTTISAQLLMLPKGVP